MKPMPGAGVGVPAARSGSYALVWIDSHEARLVRWADGPRLAVVTSDVPVHRRSTGDGRPDGVTGHGGAGPEPAEPRRLAHLERYLERVAAELDGVAAVEVLGPGTVREHLVRVLGRSHPGGLLPAVTTEAAPRMTERQLIAELRRRLGLAPPRRAVGAGR
ncbi:MAG TPA: hypothetical protein VF763_03315 [Candidatus Limnocylindrales bacterium]